MTQNPEINCLYELSTLQKIVSQSSIPAHVSSIAFYMAIYSYVLFSIWLIGFAYSSYQNLKRNNQRFILIFAEYLVLALVYYFIINPGLSIYIQAFGSLYFIILAIVITVYVLYYNRMKIEKE